MKTIILAMVQSSLGCATESRNTYLAAKRRYENCLHASPDGQNCSLLREEVDDAAQRYSKDAFFPSLADGYLNSRYRDPIGRI
jgi:hypothetical protein